MASSVNIYDGVILDERNDMLRIYLLGLTELEYITRRHCERYCIEG